MSAPVKWKAGIADQVWKVLICARDTQKAKDLLQGLAYVLAGSGLRSEEECAKIIAGYSGEEIAAAIFDYHNSNLLSVERGLNKQ